MLAAIFSQVGMGMINAVLGQFLEAFKAYENKQISVEQLKDQLYGIMVNAARDVEVAQADALTKTYASFMGAMVQSKILQWVWATAVISQLFVLFWSQFLVPLLFSFGLLTSWKAGTTADWAYLLVGALLGMGPMVLRAGPAGGSFTDKMKAMVGK
jgi:hypothetical protein